MDSLLQEHISCSLCLQTYQDPYALRCLHSFCHKCIQPLVQNELIECPYCKQITPFLDMQKDFKTEALIQTINKDRADRLKCDMCDDLKSKVISKCVDCDQVMCARCGVTHSKMKMAKHHEVKPIHSELFVPTSLPELNNDNEEPEKAIGKKYSKTAVFSLQADRNVALTEDNGPLKKQLNKKDDHPKHCKSFKGNRDSESIAKGISHINIVSPIIRQDTEYLCDKKNKCLDDTNTEYKATNVVEKANVKKSRWNNWFSWGHKKKRTKDYWDDKKCEFEHLTDEYGNRTNDATHGDDYWLDRNQANYNKNEYWDEGRITGEDKVCHWDKRWDDESEEHNLNQNDGLRNNYDEKSEDWNNHTKPDSSMLVERENDEIIWRNRGDVNLQESSCNSDDWTTAHTEDNNAICSSFGAIREDHGMFQDGQFEERTSDWSEQHTETQTHGFEWSDHQDENRDDSWENGRDDY